MSCRFLKVQTFIVVSTLSIAMLLFAAQRHDLGAGPQFHAIVDLSEPNAPGIGLSSSRETILVAPAKLGGAWTLDTLPPVRLIAPVAVIRAQHKNFPDSESLVTMDDVATFEREHGAVPQGAIVLLSSGKTNTTPHFHHDALHFLIEARNVVGIGSEGAHVVAPEENPYLAAKGIYELENAINISLIPQSGVIAVAAPQKISGATEGPVRLMALVK